MRRAPVGWATRTTRWRGPTRRGGYAGVTGGGWWTGGFAGRCRLQTETLSVVAFDVRLCLASCWLGGLGSLLGGRAYGTRAGCDSAAPHRVGADDGALAGRAVDHIWRPAGVGPGV